MDIKLAPNEALRVNGNIQKINPATGNYENVGGGNINTIKINNIELTPDSNKAVNIPLATSSSVGVVKPDGTSITISDGVISTPVASSLSSHTSNSDIHFTSAERTKLSGIATGAQVNVLEGVKVGTTALTPTNKVVTVPLATSNAVGVVKPDGTTITVDANGVLSAVGGGGGSSDITSADITLNPRGYDTSADFVFVTLTQSQKDAFYAENSAAAVNDYAITAVTESTPGGGQVTRLPTPRARPEPVATVNTVYVGNLAVGDWEYSSDNNQILFVQNINSYSATAYSIWATGDVIGERSRLPGYILGTQSDKPLAPAEIIDDVNTMSTKLSGIAAGAQVNVLEGVKVGSTQLTATNKVVTIPTATTSALGVVKPDGTTITVSNGIITAVGGGSGGGGGSSGPHAYTFNTPAQTTSTTDASNDTISVQLADRAMNIVSLASGISYLNVTFPQPTAGYARDFFVRLIITGSVPTISFSEYDNSSPSFDIADSAWADVEQGVNIIMFTETSQS